MLYYYTFVFAYLGIRFVKNVNLIRLPNPLKYRPNILNGRTHSFVLGKVINKVHAITI